MFLFSAIPTNIYRGQHADVIIICNDLFLVKTYLYYEPVKFHAVLEDGFRDHE